MTNAVIYITPMILQGIADSQYSLAKLMHYPGEPFLNQMAKLSVTKSAEFIPKEFAYSLWAFSSLRHDPGREYFDKMVGPQGTDAAVASFRGQDISMTLVAAARLPCFPDGPFLEALVLEAGRKLGDLNLKGLSNLLWSLCLLQKCSVEMWCQIGTCLGQDDELADVTKDTTVELQRIYQVTRDDLLYHTLTWVVDVGRMLEAID